MAADPNIFQQYLAAPKSVIDYSNDYARADALKNQNALQALTLQQQGAATQQGLQERNALQRIAATSGGDRNALISGLQNSGLPGLVDRAESMRKADADLATSQSTAAKNNADAGKTTQESQLALHQQHLQGLSTVNTPEDAMNWMLTGVQSGALPKQGLQNGLQTLQAAVQTPEGFAQWKKQMQQAGMTVQQQMEQITPKPTEFRLGNAVKVIDTNPNSASFGKEVIGQQQIGVSPDTVATNATSRSNNAATIAAENTRAGNSLAVEKVKADPYGTLGLNTTVPASTSAAAGLSGEDYLKTLPAGAAAQVRAMSNGKLQITPQSLKTPQGQELLRMAMQFDPGTDQTTYMQRSKTVQDFAPGGKDGQAITNLNTAIHHAGQLSDAIDNLNNSNIVPGVTNPIENYLGQKVLGQTTQGVYKQKADALSSELRKVYAGGGGGSLSELNEWQKSFDQNASRNQQKAYLSSGMELLVGALQAKRDAYERGMGSRADFGQFITPESTRVLSKLAPDFASQIGKSGAGKPTPAAANGQPTVSNW